MRHELLVSATIFFSENKLIYQILYFLPSKIDLYEDEIENIHVLNQTEHTC